MTSIYENQVRSIFTSYYFILAAHILRTKIFAPLHGHRDESAPELLNYPKSRQIPDANTKSRWCTCGALTWIYILKLSIRTTFWGLSHALSYDVMTTCPDLTQSRYVLSLPNQWISQRLTAFQSIQNEMTEKDLMRWLEMGRRNCGCNSQ